jgi:hypothetical protein
LRIARRLTRCSGGYQRLGFGAENATWRSFYLTGALDLRHGVKPSLVGDLGAGMAGALTIEQLLEALVRGGSDRCRPLIPLASRMGRCHCNSRPRTGGASGLIAERYTIGPAGPGGQRAGGSYWVRVRPGAKVV